MRLLVRALGAAWSSRPSTTEDLPPQRPATLSPAGHEELDALDVIAAAVLEHIDRREDELARQAEVERADSAEC